LTTFLQIKPLIAVRMSCHKSMLVNYSQSFMCNCLETGQKLREFPTFNTEIHNLEFFTIFFWNHHV